MITTPSAPDGYIRIGHYDSSTELLGSGKRFALWVQGCKRHCKGCIAENMQKLDGGSVWELTRLSDLICAAVKEYSLDGITISGGEPFLQADKLCGLLELIQSKLKRHIGTVIYTGFTVQQLLDSPDEYAGRLIQEYTDVLIDGEYIEALNDDKGLRGSSNQRIIHITDLYRGYDPYENPQKRKCRFTAGSDTMFMTGVPSKAAAELVKKFR